MSRGYYISRIQSTTHSLIHSHTHTHIDTRIQYTHTHTHKIILLMPKPNETTFRVIYRWAHQIHWFMNMAENVFFSLFLSLRLILALILVYFVSFFVVENIAITASKPNWKLTDWMTRADKYDDIISEWKEAAAEKKIPTENKHRSSVQWMA